MYLGQATFYQERMNDFLNVAKSLEIKEISKDVDCNVPDFSEDQEVDEEIAPNIENTHEESQKIRPANLEEEKEDMSSKVISKRNEADQYPCTKCDKKFSQRKNLFRHMRVEHEGIRLPCDDCNFKAKRKDDLNIHIQSVHEGKKFPCNLCDFKTTRVQRLKQHMKNKH